jgi:catechol 2,3-dioxygenase-like lactoylglutathione lyase family enzyme
MLAHVTIRVSDRTRSEHFYRTVLGAIGLEPTHELPEVVAWDDYALIQAEDDHPPTRHLHVGFVAPSREKVDRFWQAGVEAGYADIGAPGERLIYRPGYYGAFLCDPDGNSIEAVHHDNTRRGGNIDHFWIGVRDLDAAAAFYTTISRYVGLRDGRRWSDGRQFLDAWTSFSLVADGRPPTEQLHVAFLAPDRIAVDQFHAAATAAGYRDNGGPGERPQYSDDYYAAFVLDPDGTNVEAVRYGSPGGSPAGRQCARMGSNHHGGKPPGRQ